jgi:hypothetical protein
MCTLWLYSSKLSSDTYLHRSWDVSMSTACSSN